jgi:hypothetical protein
VVLALAWRRRVRRWSDDSWAYTEAKTGVFLDILEQLGLGSGHRPDATISINGRPGAH